MAFPASIHRLENNLTLIHQEIPHIPIVTSDIWVKAGSTREAKSWFGMAHFLEHMIFKGTANIPPGAFDRHIENLGCVSSAGTSYEYAQYTLTSAATHVAATLPQLAEILLHAEIPDDEFLRERDVVLEEIRSYQDDLDWIGEQNLFASIYQNHPYGRSVLGEESDILQHTPAAMRCFHRSHYRPENITVVIIGGIDRESAVNLVENSFQFPELSSNGVFPIAEHTPILPIAGIRRQEISSNRLETARLMMGWLVPGVEQLNVCYGMYLLSALLAWGRTSRLIRDLREERQLVQEIYCDFSLQKQSSLFTITAWLEPEDLELVESLIRLHLQDIIDRGITERELKRCQRMLCNDYAFSTETPDQLAKEYGYYNIVAKAELALTYPQQILSFNPQQLQELAREYISPDRYAVTILKPNSSHNFT